MDEIALAPYQRREFTFGGWADMGGILPQLLPRSLAPAMQAPSTGSDPDMVPPNSSTPVQPKGKNPATGSSWAPGTLQAQIQRLQTEKEAALKKIRRMEEQQRADQDFLSRTAAGVQNATNTAAQQTQQLSTTLEDWILELTTLVKEGFARIEGQTWYLHNCNDRALTGFTNSIKVTSCDLCGQHI